MIKKIFNASQDIFLDFTVNALIKRFLFILKAISVRKTINTFITKVERSGYYHVFLASPSVFGVLIWPYINKDWCVAKRFEAIANHYEILKSLPLYLDVSDNKRKTIIDLGHYSENVSLVLDKPRWFVREGEIVLNLFRNDLRVMSLAFSFGLFKNEKAIYIGGIQGIHSGVSSEESLEIIRKITKDFEGLRPRSCLIEVIKMIAHTTNVKKILAVSDSNRHHRHPYFNNYVDKISTGNYDTIWLESHGVLLENGFFGLPIEIVKRDLSEVSSNKRAMYRRRYEIIDDVYSQLKLLN